MIVLALIAVGMVIGGLAQMLFGKTWAQVDKAMALVAGLVGSFVGGLLINLIQGNGFEFQISGLIGSFVGAVIVTLIWQKIRDSKAA